MTDKYVLPVLRGKVLICGFCYCSVEDVASRSAKHGNSVILVRKVLEDERWLS